MNVVGTTWQTTQQSSYQSMTCVIIKHCSENRYRVVNVENGEQNILGICVGDALFVQGRMLNRVK